MGIAGFILWAVFIAVGFYIHPLAGVVLLVIALFLYFDELMSALGSLGNTRYEEPQLPARRSVDVAVRHKQHREAIAHQKEIVTDMIIARRHVEETKGREFRLLVEHLKEDRNLSSDAEVRSIVAQFNAHQIHGTANDWDRDTRAAHAKITEIVTSAYNDYEDDDYYS